MATSATSRHIGRSFVHPAFDYAVIGGGLSLVLTVLVLALPQDSTMLSNATLAVVFLVVNKAHFAASTVRLYSKPDAKESLPFLTMVFPLVSLGVVALCIALSSHLARHLTALYLTWSPYHYAAQAYGLAVMYSYRSGCKLTLEQKRHLRWVAMIPFVQATITGAGLVWVLPEDLYRSEGVQAFIDGAAIVLPVIAVVATSWLYVSIWRSKSGPMPLLALLMVVANGVWFFVLSPLHAFVWATIFHSVQYLAIVTIFHIKDHAAENEAAGVQRTRAYQAVWFYGACLLLGYGLFQCLPWGFTSMGFDFVESVLVIVAAINLHHFIVDGFIWKLGKRDTNRRIVGDDAGAAPAGAVPV